MALHTATHGEGAFPNPLSVESRWSLRGGVGEGKRGGTFRLDRGVSLCLGGSRSLSILGSSVAPAHIHPSRFMRVVLSRNQLLASLKQIGYEEVEVKPTPPLP